MRRALVTTTPPDQVRRRRCSTGCASGIFSSARTGASGISAWITCSASSSGPRVIRYSLGVMREKSWRRYWGANAGRTKRSSTWIGWSFSKWTITEWNTGAPGTSPISVAVARSQDSAARRWTRAECRWPRSTISSWMLRISSSAERGRRAATRVPAPGRRSSTPSSARSRSAPCTVMRAVPKPWASTDSDGIR